MDRNYCYFDLEEDVKLFLVHCNTTAGMASKKFLPKLGVYGVLETSMEMAIISFNTHTVGLHIQKIEEIQTVGVFHDGMML